ncbi:hypothetical protein scyTo_0022199, partial [Scyliorhinus torazame]|nr:hypothetical protein [Scyliorhinus torazame]
MSRAPPPRFDIPRNLSYISGLYEKAYYASQRPSPGWGEEEGGEDAEEAEAAGSRDRGRLAAAWPWAAGGGSSSISSRRRRARSLPARAESRRSRSPDTRKRVRFADSLGLELAAVKRFSQWEAPRVPIHVQAQLQRDAIRHFGAQRDSLAFK